MQSVVWSKVHLKADGMKHTLYPWQNQYQYVTEG